MKKGAVTMVISSKELLLVLQLLATVREKEKEMLLTHLRGQTLDNADTLSRPASFQVTDEE